MFHWFLYITGVTNLLWYNWWSGIVGDLALLGGFAMLYKKLNCHVRGCYRIGLHHVANGKYTTCIRHHPDMGKNHVITPEVVAKAHKQYNKRI